MVDERILAERLISYDTSRAEELVAAAGFVKGWLESRDIEVLHHDHNGLPVLVAEVGPAREDLPCVVFHGHLDVVPGRQEQYEPRIDGDKLFGRAGGDDVRAQGRRAPGAGARQARVRPGRGV